MRNLWFFYGFMALLLAARILAADDIVIEDAVPQDVAVPVSLVSQFDAMLGMSQQNVMQTRWKLQLQARIEAIDARWPLTAEQREKLQLAGRGDIARLNAEIVQLRREAADNQQTLAEFHREALRRVTIPAECMFTDDSLYFKVLRRQLTEQQWLRFEVRDRAERETQVRSLLTTLYTGKNQLTEAQKRELAELFLSKYPRWRPLSKNVSCSQYIPMLMAAELGDEIRPMFTDDQWRVTQNLTRTARALEPRFRSYGLWPIDRLEAEVSDR